MHSGPDIDNACDSSVCVKWLSQVDAPASSRAIATAHADIIHDFVPLIQLFCLFQILHCLVNLEGKPALFMIYAALQTLKL